MYNIHETYYNVMRRYATGTIKSFTMFAPPPPQSYDKRVPEVSGERFSVFPKRVIIA